MDDWIAWAIIGCFILVAICIATAAGVLGGLLVECGVL